MDISESCRDREIWADFGQSRPDVVDVFGLCVKRVVVNIFVVDTVFFTTSDPNFLSIVSITQCLSRSLSYHLEPLLHWRSTFQIFFGSLDIPIHWLL